MPKPYTPDLEPFDYHLFRSLQKSLDDKKIGRNAENYSTKSFAVKTEKFFTDNAKKLRENRRDFTSCTILKLDWDFPTV